MLRADFYPKKRFGQSFLIDKNIVKKIIDASTLTKDDVVLEIGPGKGILTQQLAQKARKVIAVEVDKKLFINLTDSLSRLDNILLFNQDILKFDLKNILNNLKIKKRIKIVANIPYNITSAIFDYIFHRIDLFKAVYVMVQREYAQRVVAAPDTAHYSSLSCFVQYYTTPRILFRVAPSCFRPQPKVDSCFIELAPRLHCKELAADERELLFTIIRAAFNQRRKNIINALSSLLEKEAAMQILSTLALDYRLRAENISLDGYLLIMHEMKNRRTQDKHKEILSHRNFSAYSRTREA